MPHWIKMLPDKSSDQEFNSMDPHKDRWRILLYKLFLNATCMPWHACLHIHIIHMCMYIFNNKHFRNVIISFNNVLYVHI